MMSDMPDFVIGSEVSPGPKWRGFAVPTLIWAAAGAITFLLIPILGDAPLRSRPAPPHHHLAVMGAGHRAPRPLPDPACRDLPAGCPRYVGFGRLVSSGSVTWVAATSTRSRPLRLAT